MIDPTGISSPLRRAAAYAAAAALAVLALIAAPPAVAASAATLPPVRHVFVIVLENKEFAEWFGLGRTYNPYLTQTLPSQGILIPNYFGIGHSSADNYIGLISGQPPTADSKNDCPDPLRTQSPNADANGVAPGNGCAYPPNYLTIGDQLTAHGLTWKAYAESMPEPCYLGHDAPGNYARKHDAFPYFQSVVGPVVDGKATGQCLQDNVPLTDAGFEADLADPGKTANVNYIFPNECDDGHSDCQGAGANPVPEVGSETDEMGQYDAFLRKYVPMITGSKAFKQHGLLVITFDEGYDPFGCCGEPMQDPDGSYPGGEFGSPGNGGGQVGAVALSPFISPGTETTSQYNHYSLLASIEDLFGLPHLGEARLPGTTMFGSDVYNNAPVSGAGAGSRRHRVRRAARH
jgi:hypothetical protein